MSLYRSWRPKTFDDLVGQEAVVRTLRSALQSGKLAHAYLFSGPRGSGKTSAAKILARCIDCVNGPTPTPDNTCENCLAIIAGTALDVLEIDAASNRGIDEIRALRDAVKFAPSTMRMKVYIIDEAHMLTKEGANAFLKTLEEPPPHVVFILATTEPEKLPPTILSRCQRYAFARIAIPVMIDRMRTIAAAEKMEVDGDALAAIAYRADGGLRDALTMLEQAWAFSDGRITTETIDLAFGAAGRNYAGSLLDALLERDAGAALRTIDEACDAGTDMAVLMRNLIAQMRNVLVARIDQELLARDVAPEDVHEAVRRGSRLTQAQLVRGLRLLSDALVIAKTSGNARLELETALLRYTLAGDDPTLDALAARVTALEANRPAPPAPVKAAAEPAAPQVEAGADKDVTIGRVRAAWQSIRSRVESHRQPLRGPLSRAQPEAVTGNELTIKLPTPPMAEKLRENAELIESAIAQVLGTALRVKFTVDGAAKAGSRATSAQAAAPANPADDPDELFSYLNERIK